MNLHQLVWIFLGLACCPFIYYLLAIYSTITFFRQRPRSVASPGPEFTPPVSNLKPVRGTDPDAYDNFASFCRQDYPEYEVIFCVDNQADPVVPVLERLGREYPEAQVKILFGSGRVATNDKVAKLARMVGEAKYQHLVISDSDVRAQSDYLRNVIAPMRDPAVGAVTCLYVLNGEASLVDRLQSIGMMSDFYGNLLVARTLEGVKFTLGPTIATTKEHLAEFGGYPSIENKPADDLWVGRLIAENGHRVELLDYTIESVADFDGFRDLLHKRMRWLVVQRHMRIWGHVGLLFTQGLPWSLLAVAVHPTLATAVAFLGSYLILRVAMTSLIGVWGLRQKSVWNKLPLIILWDALAFAMWLASFTRKTIRWRNAFYLIQDGCLVPLPTSPASAP